MMKEITEGAATHCCFLKCVNSFKVSISALTLFSCLFDISDEADIRSLRKSVSRYYHCQSDYVTLITKNYYYHT